MIELISIHLPKTGGTSFYNILQQVYGDRLSISYKRRDHKEAIATYGAFSNSVAPTVTVLHGHLRYEEIKDIHENHSAKIITWLRDPVQRVISNYRFFIAGLHDPTRNPKNHAINKHRINETLLEYAAIPANQNRMSSFLEGLPSSEFDFIGLLEYFEEDLQRLAQLLHWPPFDIPRLNTSRPNSNPQDKAIIDQIATWNSKDMTLYQNVLEQLNRR